MGVRAVTFSELPAALGLPSIHATNRYWDPFFAACEETGTVICMHIGSASIVPITSEDAPAHVQISSPRSTPDVDLRLVAVGAPGAFPGLQLAYSEGQIGWIPFQLERLDTLWRKHNYRRRMGSDLGEPPSHYYRRHITGCFFEDDFGLTVLDKIGVDNVTFETDYPHQDSTWPNSKAYAEKIMGHLPQDIVNKIVRDNAIRLFDLPPTLPDR